MNDSLTILVSSCDKYEDLWEPFFYLLHKNWKELEQYPIVLNTETKKFSMEGLNIQCLQLYSKGEKVSWGKRLIDTLKEINSEYILFFLDDYFITDVVDNNKVMESIKLFEKDTEAAVFYLIPTEGGIENESLGNFLLLKNDATWKLNTSIGIWKKKYLMSYIMEHESPWAWEQYGSIRARNYKQHFYTWKSAIPVIFNFAVEWGGAIHRGKWTPYAIQLCKDNNISIDFSIRGYETGRPPFDEDEFATDKKGIAKVFRRPFIKRVKRYIKYLIEGCKEKKIREKSLSQYK